jgi:hypothetical protein
MLIVVGCAKRTDQPATVPAPAEETPIKHRDLAGLPPVGDHLPPLDEGRIEVAPPAEWNVIRSPKTLVVFAKGKANELPRIVVTADAAPADSPPEVTEANAWSIAAERDKRLRGAKKLVEEPGLPIVLGETVFIRHVRRAEMAHSPVAVQSLETLRAGRRYTVELIAEIDAPRAADYHESLTKWRDFAYAVAANIKFAAVNP